MKAWVNTGYYWVFFFLLGFWINGLVWRAKVERMCAEHLASALLQGFESGLLEFGPEAGSSVSTDSEATTSPCPIPSAKVTPAISKSAAARERSRERREARMIRGSSGLAPP